MISSDYTLIEIAEGRLARNFGTNGEQFLEEAREEDYAAFYGPGDLNDVIGDLSPDAPVARTSWGAVDLGPALAGEGIEPPSLLARTDGKFMLYSGRVHWFQGESESCKTWAALLATKQALAAGVRVLWIDFEDDDRGIVERLRSLGIAPAVIVDRFVYVRPEEPLQTKGKYTAGAGDFDDVLASGPFALAVIDGVTEAMTTEGLDLMSNTDIAVWMRLLPKRIAATGAAVVVIDHVTKSSEGRGRYALGGQHKLAGLTGAGYSFTSVTPFGRGRIGRITIKVTKDRPGHIRKEVDDEATVGTMLLESYPDEGVTIVIEPAGKRPADTKVRRKILEHLVIYPGASKTDLRTLGNSDAVDAEVKTMVGDGLVYVARVGRSHPHELTHAGHALAVEYGITE